MLWFAQALNHLSSWQKIRKERQRKDSIDRTGSLNKDCLLHPGWGVHTLKPDAARLQWNEVHYGLKCEVWVAYLPGSSIITSNVPSFFIEKDRIWGEVLGSPEPMNKELVFMCHCVKSKLENGRLSARWRRFMGGSLKKSTVCGNHSDVPSGSKQPPCQGRPSLRFVYIESYSRQRGTLHTARKDLKNRSGGEMSQLLFVPVTLLQANTHLCPNSSPDPVHTAGLATFRECSESKPRNSARCEFVCLCVDFCVYAYKHVCVLVCECGRMWGGRMMEH